MSVLRVERHPDGPRLYLAGLRAHHGLLCLMVALAALAGVWHDRRDFPWSTR